MKRGWLAVLLVGALVTCSGGSYDSEVAGNFIQSCTARGTSSKAYCNCTLDVFQRRHSQSEFQAMEVKLMSTGVMPKAMADTLVVAMKECKR